jgi:hypothetical protein
MTDHRRNPDITLHRGLLVKMAGILHWRLPLMNTVHINDAIQAVTLRAIQILPKYDASRGSVSTFLMKDLYRGMAREVAKLAGYSYVCESRVNKSKISSIGLASRTWVMSQTRSVDRFRFQYKASGSNPIDTLIEREERAADIERAREIADKAPDLWLWCQTQCNASRAARSVGLDRRVAWRAVTTQLAEVRGQ